MEIDEPDMTGSDFQQASGRRASVCGGARRGVVLHRVGCYRGVSRIVNDGVLFLVAGLTFKLAGLHLVRSYCRRGSDLAQVGTLHDFLQQIYAVGCILLLDGGPLGGSLGAVTEMQTILRTDCQRRCA